jgi:hypothetical protein
VSAATGREVIIPAGPGMARGNDGDEYAAADVDRLLTRLTRFLLRHSAEGAFELRDTVRQAAAAFGARADVLALAEGAVLEVNHADGSQYVATLRVLPELTRLDLVAEAKFLQGEIVGGRLSSGSRSRSAPGGRTFPGSPAWSMSRGGSSSALPRSSARSRAPSSRRWRWR